MRFNLKHEMLQYFPRDIPVVLHCTRALVQLLTLSLFLLAAPLLTSSMCGIGTIPFLGAGWFPGMTFLGGEVDPNAIDHLKKNRQSAPAAATSVAGADACAWDAQSLPLRDGAVDAIVVDM